MCSSSRFQFHKGAIRTLGSCSPLSPNLQFQFHKGAIRTNNADDDQLYVGNFNSIKVRLEPRKCTDLSSAGRFQFHKGAIRTQVSTKVFSLNLIFQFHKGAIRTRQLSITGYFYGYFNSIKVRLEQVAAMLDTLKSWHFNSIKVRLERTTSVASP